jgi:hypothetical protein
VAVLQKDAMHHAQKAIELDLATAGLELCIKTTDDVGYSVDTLFMGLIEAAQNTQKMCYGENGLGAQDQAERLGHQLSLPGKPSPRKPRRKSDAQPMPTLTTASMVLASPAHSMPEPEPRLALTEVPPIRLELSGQQRRLARLAAVEAERCAAKGAAIPG